MAQKQIIIELKETLRGLPQAEKDHPELSIPGDNKELWGYAEQPAYEVTRLVNSVDFCIGDKLTKEEVKDLIAKANWKVVVTKPKG